MRELSGARSRVSLFVWRDYFGAVHACERNDLRQAFYVFSTLCGRNVPPNAPWPHGQRPLLTCVECEQAVSERAASSIPGVPKDPETAANRPNYAGIGV